MRKLCPRLVTLLLSSLLWVACGGGSSAPAPAPVAAVCGNGRVESGEECDDGNANNGDACYTTCQAPVNWIPSDPHIHSTGCGVFGTPEDVERELRRQQIRLGAALVWGDRDSWEDDLRYFTGKDHPLSKPPEFVLHYDLEVSGFPADRTGHLLLLGLDALPERPYDSPYSGVPVLRWARTQPRLVAGMAHGQFWTPTTRFPVPPQVCCTPWEFPVHVARGQLDFVGLERLPADEPYPVDEGTFQAWKAAQNSGFRVAITGASDFPCITHEFGSRTPRTDVIVDGELSYERWLEGLKAGRAAAAIGVGNRLHVRVNRARVGEEVRLTEPGEVTVTLESVEPLPVDVEVLVNGLVAARPRVDGGAQLLQLKLPVQKSSWIAARSPRILTNPVYVLVGGQPVRASAEDTCYLVRWVDHVWDLAQSRRINLRESEAEALAAYAEARTELMKRFTEAGGLTCP
jgi:cysteine-rich repeat protein